MSYIAAETHSQFIRRVTRTNTSRENPAHVVPRRRASLRDGCARPSPCSDRRPPFSSGRLPRIAGCIPSTPRRAPGRRLRVRRRGVPANEDFDNRDRGRGVRHDPRPGLGATAYEVIRSDDASGPASGPLDSTYDTWRTYLPAGVGPTQTGGFRDVSRPGRRTIFSVTGPFGTITELSSPPDSTGGRSRGACHHDPPGVSEAMWLRKGRSPRSSRRLRPGRRWLLSGPGQVASSRQQHDLRCPRRADSVLPSRESPRRLGLRDAPDPVRGVRRRRLRDPR